MILNDYKDQSCVAGSRIFIQEGIYNEFLKKFTATAACLASKTGDPFGKGTEHGPQVSKVQFYVLVRWTVFSLTLLFSTLWATSTLEKRQVPPSITVVMVW